MVCVLRNILPMTLADYLKQPGRSATILATELGVAVSTITRAADGTSVPSRELMRGIHTATEGAVTPNDFFGVGEAPALCTGCDKRLDDRTIQSCSAVNCPHAQREAAVERKAAA